MSENVVQVKKYYVYEDWTTEENPRCFYVGIGSQARTKTVKRNRIHHRTLSRFGFQRRIDLDNAAKETNTSRAMISMVLNCHRETSKGYRWRYA